MITSVSSFFDDSYLVPIWANIGYNYSFVYCMLRSDAFP